jgi:hypothetical protein
MLVHGNEFWVPVRAVYRAPRVIQHPCYASCDLHITAVRTDNRVQCTGIGNEFMSSARGTRSGPVTKIRYRWVRKRPLDLLLNLGTLSGITIYYEYMYLAEPIRGMDLLKYRLVFSLLLVLSFIRQNWYGQRPAVSLLLYPDSGHHDATRIT